MTQVVLFTIGHSDLELPDLLALLRPHRVDGIADVRSVPHSSRFPQWNRAGLGPAFRQQGIHYRWFGLELGARRAEPECYTEGRACYERIADLPAFQDGLRRLRGAAAQGRRIALLCAERDPLECHRTVLVARHLHGPSLQVLHILADGSLEPHAATETRLRRTVGVAEPSLFCSAADLLTEAYRRQGRLLAWQGDPEQSAPGATQ